MDDDSISPSALLTSRQVSERLGVGITGLHEIMRHDGTFPPPYRYGPVLLHREDLVELWRQSYRKYRKRTSCRANTLVNSGADPHESV